MASERTRPAWSNSNRKGRLPQNWNELRALGHQLNPEHICHVCGKPGGSDFDHKTAGDDSCQQPQVHVQPCTCNLDWCHNRTDFLAGRSDKNCHGEKSAGEGARALAAKLKSQRRPPEQHPAFAD
ncbi:hypothetical protein [Actinoplanes sp. URMC 104]|uniref:hypothetical protein n=1 Tax=Actinoplanes sp. URMC 104 TaxID=3423409 RepID=UPI003F193E8E